MSVGLFFIVLATAFMHAGWNAVVKNSGERTVMMFMIALAPALVAGPALFFLPLLDSRAIPWLVGSVVLHAGYVYALIAAYKKGDLSHVYPIARGSAPLLVALGGWILAGEVLNAWSFLAIATITLGIYLLGRSAASSLDRKAHPSWRTTALAFLTGLFIAGYSVVDGMGARVSGSPLTYSAWLGVFQIAPITILAVWVHGKSLPSKLKGTWKKGMAGGLVAWSGYTIIIWAMTQAPLAHVVAVRETSVLIATVIGVVLFKESFGLSRLSASTMVLGGIAILRLLA